MGLIRRISILLICMPLCALGATPNDATDDTAAIQAAVDAAGDREF